MQSPAVGKHLGELVLDREPTFDRSSMIADRFALGRQRTETLVI